MKIKVSNRELKECITNVMNRIISEGKSKTRSIGIDKATKKGNRDAEKEIYGDGFKSYDKVHKSQKDYSRKGKGKWKYDEELNEDRLNLNSPEDVDIEGEDVLNKQRFYTDYQENDTTPGIEVKTDIQDVETELIDKILSNFELVDTDNVDGYFTFIVPVKMEGEFIDFLRSEDVNIIE